MTNRRQVIFLLVALLLPAFGFYAKLGFVADPHLQALFFGLSILGAAFLLSWASETAQLDISKSLAFAVLALIAILPEYAVDIYFSWTAASQPEYAAYASANMTGANRLLIGLGWSLVVFLTWIKFRKSKIELKKSERVELSFLFFASLYAFVIALKGSFSLVDTVVLSALFIYYIFRVSRTHKEEPHLVGPAKMLGSFSRNRRRLSVVLLMLFSAVVIFESAEPFAESLITSGKSAGVDEFLLIQWVAPLASEAPEFIIALIFVLRALARSGFEVLLSSKINQWTLLVATIPLAYSLALGAPSEMVMDARQVEEIFLTAAQSLFAMSVMLNLRITLKGATTLFVLFMIQFFLPATHIAISVVYLVLAAYLFWRDRAHIKPLIMGIVR